jgi:hypothetical protein
MTHPKLWVIKLKNECAYIYPINYLVDRNVHWNLIPPLWSRSILTFLQLLQISSVRQDDFFLSAILRVCWQIVSHMEEGFRTQTLEAVLYSKPSSNTSHLCDHGVIVKSRQRAGYELHSHIWNNLNATSTLGWALDEPTPSDKGPNLNFKAKCGHM